MTIRDFYNNPAGKGVSVLNLKATKKDFDERYSKNVKKILHFIYNIKGNIYIHFKIPSSVNHIYYDVVVKFTPNNKSTGSSLHDMDVSFFSNSPSFLYTYANVYFKKRLFINELRKKLSPKILKTISEKTNPYQVVSYDYSIYFAIKFILENGLTDMRYIDEYASNKFNDLVKNIGDWENIQLERSIEKRNMDEARRKEREMIKQSVKHSDYVGDGKKKDKNITRVERVKKVNSVKKTKNSKKI